MSRESRGISYLSKEEVERLFRVIPAGNARDRLLFDVIYRYGLRRLEATLLRLEHLKDGRIWIGRVKNGVSGEYPIHPHTRKLLWAYLPERKCATSPYLFTTRQSGENPVSVGWVFQLFRRYALAAKIPIERAHPHCLRHGIATHLLSAGLGIADVQDWLGHKNITSTMVYAQITNKRREEMYEKAMNSAEIANG